MIIEFLVSYLPALRSTDLSLPSPLSDFVARPRQPHLKFGGASHLSFVPPIVVCLLMRAPRRISNMELAGIISMLNDSDDSKIKSV